VPEHVIHWDDVESEYDEAGTIGSTWNQLARAAGSKRVNMNRIRVAPGRRSTPLHSETDEEIFFVLAGGGLSWQREGGEDRTFEVRAGDCLVHLAGAEPHTLVAGDEGIDVLAFGSGPTPAFAFFPRLDVMRLGPAILDVDGRHQWDLEGALDDPELPAPSSRPKRIVNWHDVEPEHFEHGDVSVEIHYLGEAAGSVQSGIRYNRIAPRMLSCPPHCHSVEEELFVILEGEGSCLLGDEEHPVRAGHVVARPASSRVAHAFRAGPDGMTTLSYGTRDPNDIAYYPRSDKIYFRGVGVMARLERLEYWDGEEDSTTSG
jgi:uncharacterized cupin superfamily protein